MGARGRPRKRGRSRPGPNGGRPGSSRGERPGRGDVPELREMTPFSVFCVLHLGITDTDGYSRQDLGAVARRFGSTPEDLQDYLRANRLLREDLRAAKFDLASAQLDIQVAPEGISRTELARTLFTEFEEYLKNGAPNGDGPPEQAPRASRDLPDA